MPDSIKPAQLESAKILRNPIDHPPLKSMGIVLRVVDNAKINTLNIPIDPVNNIQPETIHAIIIRAYLQGMEQTYLKRCYLFCPADNRKEQKTSQAQ